MRVDKKKVLKDLNILLTKRFADDLKDVVLFGSHANGRAHKDSDYDILIILKNKPDWVIEREISDLCYEVDLKYSIVDFSISEVEILLAEMTEFINTIKVLLLQ